MLLAIEWVSGDLVAIAAIVVGGTVSLVAVTMTGRNDKQARKDQRRFETYSTILPIVWRIMRQASEHAISPGVTTVSDPDDDEVGRAESLLALIGSSAVRDAFREWRNQLGPYWVLVWNAAQARRRVDDQMSADTDLDNWHQAQGEAETERLKLIGPVGELEEAAAHLEKVMRAELT